MDPQSQFKKRYDEFIKMRQIQLQKGVVPLSKTRHPFNKFYLLGLLIGAALVLPIVSTILSSNTDNGNQTIIATQTTPQITPPSEIAQTDVTAIPSQSIASTTITTTLTPTVTGGICPVPETPIVKINCPACGTN